MHTNIRAQEVPISTSSSFFKGKMGEKAPRFDKIIQNANYGDKMKRSTSIKPFVKKPLVSLESIEDTLAKNRSPQGVNYKQIALDFMRGQPYNITEYLEN
jgi:hypothetical protein